MIRPPRKVLAYAVAIAVPTLVLLALGLQSVRRQQQAIVQLEACLRDSAWATAATQPSPARLLALRQRHPVACELVLVDGREVAGGSSAYGRPNADALRGVSVHPDGRTIAYTAGFPTWEIWAMEGIR